MQRHVQARVDGASERLVEAPFRLRRRARVAHAHVPAAPVYDSHLAALARPLQRLADGRARPQLFAERPCAHGVDRARRVHHRRSTPRARPSARRRAFVSAMGPRRAPPPARAGWAPRRRRSPSSHTEAARARGEAATARSSAVPRNTARHADARDAGADGGHERAEGHGPARHGQQGGARVVGAWRGRGWPAGSLAVQPGHVRKHVGLGTAQVFDEIDLGPGQHP